VRSYEWLLSQGFRPEHIALVGDSAGGALAVTTLLLLRERGLPLPAASMPLSPWTDLLVTGDTVVTNHEKDHFVKRHVIDHLSAVYLGDDGNSAARRDPLASPLYADLNGLPPLYVQVGGDETLLDDARRLVEAAKAAGVNVTFSVHRTAARIPLPGGHSTGGRSGGARSRRVAPPSSWRTGGTTLGPRLG
jgi:acetyl esterase/lipase